MSRLAMHVHEVGARAEDAKPESDVRKSLDGLGIEFQLSLATFGLSCERLASYTARA
jgi:hypothetical protein